MSEVKIKAFLIVGLLFQQLLWANLADDFGIEKKQENPKYFYGAGVGGRLYTGSVNTWVYMNGGGRIIDPLSIQLIFAFMPNNSYKEFGIQLEYLGDDHFFYEHNEDFFWTRFSILRLTDLKDFTTEINSPTIIFGYGQRMMLWENFPWGFQFAVYAGFSNEYFVAENEFFNSTGRAFAGIDVGIFHWK